MKVSASTWVAIAAIALLVGCGDDSPSQPSRSAAGGADNGSVQGKPDPDLAQRLRHGGYVLVFRHAETDSATDMTGDLSDCSRQRNLDAAGRRQARAIGVAIRRLEIPIARVLASPFCRTRETARLAFGHVRPSRALLSVEFLKEAGAGTGSSGGMRPLLRTQASRTTNTVLVSHESAIDAATGVALEEGDAVVVKPGNGPHGFRVVARLAPEDFERLR